MKYMRKDFKTMLGSHRTPVQDKNANESAVFVSSTIHSMSTYKMLPKAQWHATVLLAEAPSAKAKYPTNAPTATAIITMPLYVINRSLF